MSVDVGTIELHVVSGPTGRISASGRERPACGAFGESVLRTELLLRRSEMECTRVYRISVRRTDWRVAPRRPVVHDRMQHDQMQTRHANQLRSPMHRDQETHS
jgi:hypothetical protein